MAGRIARRRLTRVAGLSVVALIPGFGPGTGGDDTSDYRAFFEAVPTGQFVMDPSRRIRRANTAARLLFLPSGGELKGRLFTDFIAPASENSVDLAFALVAAEGRNSPPLSAQGRTADGVVIPIEIVIVQIPGGVQPGYGAIVRDLRGGPPVPGAPAPQSGTAGSYTLAELLMANRLRELV